ncbi:hypothetical protein TNCV_1746691 [Trichonephila clavipes]|nr:hypothetical protein TNCV_1746691 [Trichonephila clavipes]
MPTKGIQAMIKRFEETRKLEVESGRGCTLITQVLVDAQISEFGSSSAHAVSRQTGIFGQKRGSFIQKRLDLVSLYQLPQKRIAEG